MVLASLTSLRGGSGKTTSAAHIAAGLSTTGRTVLFDADPQQSAADWSGLPGVAMPFALETPATSTIEECRDKYDHVIVDCPPGLLPVIEDVISKVELVISPCRPTPLDLAKVGELVAMVNRIRGADGLPVLRFLLTQVKEGTLLQRDSRTALVRAGLEVFKTEIRDWQVIARAGGLGISVGDLNGYEAVVYELLAYDAMLDDN